VRIQGLVRLANTVRREIGRGVVPARKSQLRAAVARAVAQIDQILHDRRARPSNLATPSKRAYEYLTAVDWDALPVRQSAPAAPPIAAEGTIRFPGLSRFVDRITARLAADPSPPEVAEIARALDQTHRRIESTIQRQNVSPDQLTAATRDLRGWLAWAAVPANLALYAAAVGAARAALIAAAPPSAKPTRYVIELRPTRHLYRLRTRAGVGKLLLPTPMVRFDSPGFADVARLILTHDRDVKRRIVDRLRDRPCADLLTELEILGGVVDSTRGGTHDLAASFDRVNAAHFDGRMPRPRLSWSRSFTRRKFGHYDHLRDWVMVSSTLDQPHVPQFVVDYLMFHELLHKKHGIRWVNGRGLAHTRAFYADERRFPQYDEADEWLKRLARGK
jgi:hypothetical protein